MIRTIGAFLLLGITMLASSDVGVAGESVNLVGTWSGEWSGNMTHPITVHITEHAGAEIDGKVVLTTQQWGDHKVDISQGTVSGETVTIIFWMGEANRHKDIFTLTLVDANTLMGTGKGARHVGPVSLTRDNVQ